MKQRLEQANLLLANIPDGRVLIPTGGESLSAFSELSVSRADWTSALPSEDTWASKTINRRLLLFLVDKHELTAWGDYTAAARHINVPLTSPETRGCKLTERREFNVAEKRLLSVTGPRRTSSS